jgi:2-polyprenyl-3-methyl-5-hydroxy-6-metoxy-1,4-benzoquinol methylase
MNELLKQEQQRIEQYYQQRAKNTALASIYTVFNPENFYIVQSREKAIISLLKRHNITHLQNLRLLDVGCGACSPTKNENQ